MAVRKEDHKENLVNSISTKMGRLFTINKANESSKVMWSENGKMEMETNDRVLFITSTIL